MRAAFSSQPVSRLMFPKMHFDTLGGVGGRILLVRLDFNQGRTTRHGRMRMRICLLYTSDAADDTPC
eukprot:8325364-Pyramimonas_sp.AAC.1